MFIKTSRENYSSKSFSICFDKLHEKGPKHQMITL